MKTLKMVHIEKKNLYQKMALCENTLSLLCTSRAWDALNIFEAGLWNCHWNCLSLELRYIYICI